MTTIERIDSFRRLWGAILPKREKSVPSQNGVGGTLNSPQIPCPDDAQVWTWISLADDGVIEHGLKRLRTKVLQGEITSPDSAGRYLTAVLRAEAERRKAAAAGGAR